jgi:murein hydrolase activator
LKDLEQAALRLQKMIEELSRRSAGKSSKEAPAGSGLESMRGKLEWPVKGQVIGGFGKTKHHEFSTEVFRKGLEIEAPVGEEIRAVEKGKIVFADRFSGYGKMLIIDHGDRYYTVYAHLSDFLKKSGDPVKRGEAVALVGDSESLVGSKLYFEMRKDGRSIDPTPWFQR